MLRLLLLLLALGSQPLAADQAAGPSKADLGSNNKEVDSAQDASTKKELRQETEEARQAHTLDTLESRKSALRSSTQEDIDRSARKVVAAAQAQFSEHHQEAEHEYSQATSSLKEFLNSTQGRAMDAATKREARERINRLDRAEEQLSALNPDSIRKAALEASKRNNRVSRREAGVFSKNARRAARDWQPKSDSKNSVKDYRRDERRSAREYRKLTKQNGRAIRRAVRAQLASLNQQDGLQGDRDRAHRAQAVATLESSAWTAVGDDALAGVAKAEGLEAVAERNAFDKLSNVERQVEHLKKEMIPDTVDAHASKIWDAEAKAVASDRDHLQSVFASTSSALDELLQKAPADGKEALRKAKTLIAQVEAASQKLDSMNQSGEPVIIITM